MADFGRAALDQLGQLGHREVLGELIEDPELALPRPGSGWPADAAQGVADVQVTAGLAGPVHGQRVTDHGRTQNRFSTVPKVSS